MTNPMLPAPFHLGSYLGEQLGGGLQKGLQAGIQDSYESKVLENAFNKLSPESNAFERAKVFMSLPISDEKKKMGLQFLQQQQQQASQQQKQMMDFRKGLRKNLLDFAEQGNEFLPAAELSMVEEEASRIFAETGDPYAAYQGAIKKMSEQEAQNSDPVAAVAGIAEQNKPEGSPGVLGSLTKDAFGTYGSPFMNWLFEPGDRSPVFQKPDPDKEELFTTGFRTGSLAGTLAGEEMSAKQRENYEKAGFWGQMAFDAGAMLGDLPFFFALGPVGGIVVPAVGKVLTKDIRAEIKKEGATTPEDIGRIAMNATQELAKSATEGLLISKMPFLKPILRKIPGGEKFLNHAVGEGLTRVVEQGAIMSATRPVMEGRSPSGQDVAKGLVTAGGLEAMRIPGSLAQGMPEKAPGTPEKVGAPPESPKGPEPQKTGSNVPPGSEAKGDTSIPTGGPPGTPSPKPGEPLKKSAERTSKVFTEAQPQSGEAAVKARQERTTEALEKPIELEPSGYKKTETLQADVKTADELRAKQRELNQEARTLNELERSRVKVNEAERADINEKQIPAQEAKINALKKEVRALQRKLAGKKPKVSEEKLQEVPSEAYRVISEEAKKIPEDLTHKDLMREKNKKLKLKKQIEILKNLGEPKLPKEFTDSKIKILEAYDKAYDKIIENEKSNLDYVKDFNDTKSQKEADLYNKLIEIAKRKKIENLTELQFYKHKKANEFSVKEAEAKPKREAMKKTSKAVEKVGKRSVKEAKKLADDYRAGKAKLSEAAEAAGIDPKEAQQAKDDVKEAFEEFKQKSKEKFEEKRKEKEQKKTEEPKKWWQKVKSFKELVDALNLLRQKKWGEFFKSPTGSYLIANIVLTGLEEGFGIKIPYSRSFLTGIGIRSRGGIGAIISAVMGLAQKGIKSAKQSSKINEMADAMLARDQAKIQRLRADFKPSELKDARALYEQKYAARKKR